MARDDGGAAGTLVIAFVLGAVTGAAVALLMAPTSGEAGARVRGAAEGDVRVRHRARPRGIRAGARRRRRAGDRRRRGSVTNEWSNFFLAVIATATLVMALIQVGAIIAALRLAKQAQRVITSVQQDVKPLIARANAIADEASRTVALATAQAQKVDRLVTDLSVRVEQTAAVLQDAIVTPAREGLAIVAAIRAGVGALRGLRDTDPRTRRTAEEEDPLFIG